MKHLKWSLILIIVFNEKMGFSQQNTNDIYSPVIDKVITYFNAKDYNTGYEIQTVGTVGQIRVAATKVETDQNGDGSVTSADKIEATR